MNEATISMTTSGDYMPTTTGTPLPCHIVMDWSIYEPHIVAFEITDNTAERVVWQLDRQMVAQGLDCGGLIGWKHGDVMVGGPKHGTHFVLRLMGNSENETYVRVPRADVQTLIELSHGECGIGSQQEQLILGNIVEEMLEVSRGWTL